MFQESKKSTNYIPLLTVIFPLHLNPSSSDGAGEVGNGTSSRPYLGDGISLGGKMRRSTEDGGGMIRQEVSKIII